VAGARLREQLGPDVEFEFVWIGPYGYRDHLLERFRDGRVIFIGDSAHVVSPFGARGGNNGIQDAANLGWKLALVVRGEAPDALLDSYDAERRPAAIENLEVTSRSARFLAPRSPAEHTMRRAVVALASRHAFARGLVNTGRMAVANAYPAAPHLPQGGRSVQNLPLPLRDAGEAASQQQRTLMQWLGGGTHFVGLWREPSRAAATEALERLGRRPLRLLAVGGIDTERAGGVLPTLAADEALLRHLGLDAPGSFCLVRPDAYCAALLAQATPAGIEDALTRALDPTESP
jgi:3-(3-hydroxy-phenyl)propionate hydroxylase